jgi:hypothetical protein
VGERALRAAAVGDHVGVGGELAEPVGELVDRDVDRTGQTTRVILARGTHVQYGDRQSADRGGPSARPRGTSGAGQGEYLICDLAEHNPLDGRRCSYHVRVFEIARTSDVLVCRPVANWQDADADREDATGTADHEW